MDAAETSPFTELWDAIDEAKRCCARIPDCDATGKLRGKLWRLESSLMEAEERGDLTAFVVTARSAEELVRQIHDADPVTRLLNCLRALNARVDEVNRSSASER
jgi:hypothetical protein